MKLILVAALLADIAAQEEQIGAMVEVDRAEIDAARAELDAYHASLPADTLPPALKVWTVVQVNADVPDFAGRVGVVQGGNGDALDLDLDGDKVTLQAAQVTKLA